MENHFYHLRWAALNVTIFITHVRNLRNRCYVNDIGIRYMENLPFLYNCTIDILVLLHVTNNFKNELQYLPRNVIRWIQGFNIKGLKM